MKSILYYQEWAKEFAMSIWGMEFSIPVLQMKRNTTRTYGVIYYSRSTKKPKHIKLALHMHETHEQVLDTLKHELAHWYCLMNGLNHRDGDDDFENVLLAIGATSTHTDHDTVFNAWEQSERLKGNLTGILYHKGVKAAKRGIDKEELREIVKAHFEMNIHFEKYGQFNVSINNKELGTIYSIKTYSGKQLWFAPDTTNGKPGYYFSTRKSLVRELIKSDINNAVKELA